MKPWQLHHGDCLEVLRSIHTASIDAIVTDPPFAFAGGISNGRTSSADAQFFEHWLRDVFRELYRVSKPESGWFLWSDWRTIPAYQNALAKAALDPYQQRTITQVIVHDRECIGMGAPFRNQVEYIAFARGTNTDIGDRVGTSQPNIIRSKWAYGRHPHHPAEKPVEVARKLVCWACPPGGVVLDPFAGSGSILVAAVQAGFRAIGIEMDEEHHQTATRRLEGALGLFTMLPDGGLAS